MKEIEKTNGKKGTIRDLIVQMKDQFTMALPKHLTADRFLRVALTTVGKNPALSECTKESLLGCLMDCSSLGIEPDNRLAYLIPYGKKCTLIVSYRGLIDMARRSGEIADIHADMVYENDIFEYSFGDKGALMHKPAIRDRGEKIAAYSYVRLKDGSSSYEVMNIEEIDAIRKRSKASGTGPWMTDWAEMAKKTVFRRHSKWLPVSSEFREAVDKDYDVPIDITGHSQIKDHPKANVAMPEAIPAPKPEPAAIQPPGQDPDILSAEESSINGTTPADEPTPEFGDPEQEPKASVSPAAAPSQAAPPAKKLQPQVIALTFPDMLKKFRLMRKQLGDSGYFRVLQTYRMTSETQIKSLGMGATILGEMLDLLSTGK